MTRSGRIGPRASIARRRLGVERLEARELLASGSGLNFLSAVAIGSTGRYSSIRSNAVATDQAGDTIVAGSFRGTVAFDPSGSASASFTTAGTQDSFIASYSPGGSLNWVRTFAGQASTATGGTTTYAVGQASALTVDASGDVFVAGSFNGTVDFGQTGSPDVLSSPNGAEMFVTKLDPTGRPLWTENAVGSGGDDSASAIAPDGSGGAVLGGSFAGSITIGTTSLFAGGASDAFAARFDASGNVSWAVATSGTSGSNAGVLGIGADASGNFVLAGFIAGTVGPFSTLSVEHASTQLVSAGSDDAAVWKLSSTGAPIWARSFGSADYDLASAVGVDARGDVDVAGTFSDSVNFATGATADVLTAGPIFDAFALQLDPSGDESWARGFVGSDGYAQASAIAVDPSGAVHVAGSFRGTVDFDPGMGVVNLASVGYTDAFVAGLDSQGDAAYAVRAGQANANSALGVAVGPSGEVAVTGNFSASLHFGSVAVATAGVGNIYVARGVTISPPIAPSAPVLEAASTTGATNITSITAPVFDVTAADPADAVELLRDGVEVAQRSGPGAIQDPGPVPQGVHAYTAIQVGPTGLASPASPSTSVSFLVTPPAAPPSPTLLAADDSGVANDGITNVRRPRVQGTAPAGDGVLIVDASGSVVARTVAASDGSYVATPTGNLSDGNYQFSSRAVDAANNVGAASPPLRLTILTTPPPAPPAPSLLAADNSGAPGGSTTRIRTPHLVGTAQPGATVRLLTSAGLVVATATAGGDGSYTATVTFPLADGTYAITARAVDVAGNVGPAGASLSLTILGTGPTAPPAPVLLAADDSGVAGDGITNVKQPRLTVAAGPGLTIQIINAAGAVVGSSAIRTGSVYTITPTSPLSDGTYSFRAVAVDAANNVGSAGPALTLTILTTPPKLAAPMLLAGDDTGAIGDGRTSVLRPRIAGSGAAPGGRVDWLAADGSVLASATASATGSYVVQAPRAFPEGVVVVRVQETDVAGNLGPASPGFNLTIRATVDDFFGTGQADPTVFRPSTNAFFVRNPSDGSTYSMNWAVPGDVPVSGDFFGDGKADLAVFRPSNSTFYILDPASGAIKAVQWGISGDVPVPADYDGDGTTDIAVFRPSNATYYVINSASNSFTLRQFGITGDVPTPADYFGTGHADFAVFRPSNGTFYVVDQATNAVKLSQWGISGDVPVPADYDGDGKADLAVFRPSNATFYIQSTGPGGPSLRQWGMAGDVPISGDFLGLGRASLAVYRPGTSTFYALDLLSNAYLARPFGTPNLDQPTTPPLSSEFSFGATRHAIVVLTSPSPDSADDAILGPIVPGPTVVSPTKKASHARDLAIEGLDLERLGIG